VFHRLAHEALGEEPAPEPEPTDLPTDTQLEIFRRILEERRRQDAKWGANRHLSLDTWIRIMIEELGETAAEIEAGAPRRRELVAEAIQALAVGFAMLEDVAQYAVDRVIPDDPREPGQ